ncbi:MAG: hypothetical protein C4524_01260 [Candidatus Zixiibacteriota bacterium]|nr:MAG: hypothetical protein C4524_01260 [candidate division Zixibacteria bacterium]
MKSIVLFSKCRLVPGGLFLVLVLAAAAQGQNPGFTEVEALQEEARTQRADLLSPGHFEEGTHALEKARAVKGERAARHLETARQSLRRAVETADLVQFTFPDLVKAWDDARQQQASDLAPREFAAARKEFQSTMARMERGDLAGARKSAVQAESLLREAEVTGIGNDLLGQARKLLAEAREAGSPSVASVTYQAAVEALQRAEDFVREQRYEKEAARELAQQAAYQARHAIYLADWIKSLRKDGANWEKLIRQWEQYTGDISGLLDLAAEFDQGLEPPNIEILMALRSVQEDRRHLQEELAERDRRLGELEAEVRKLKTETGKYLAELGAQRQESERQRRFGEKINRIRNLFQPSEGEVLHSGDQVTLRLTGLRFASGAWELKAGNFDLLTRVQQALREFPDRKIEIQGHTDSQGEAKANLELSQKRAEAIRRYLLKNLNLPEASVVAAGKGESQPLTSNDTAAGRAQNRRIEIVLSP